MTMTDILEDARKAGFLVEKTGRVFPHKPEYSIHVQLEAFAKLREERVKPRRLSKEELRECWLNNTYVGYSSDSPESWENYANAIMDKLEVTGGVKLKRLSEAEIDEIYDNTLGADPLYYSAQDFANAIMDKIGLKTE